MAKVQSPLTLKHQETHGCIVNIVATDALVLKHQTISIHNAEFFSARKNDEIYISEDLTERRATLLYHARSLRRNGHLKFCWTRDGSVYVKIHDSVENRESPGENETNQKKTLTKIMTEGPHSLWSGSSYHWNLRYQQH